jgi:hypothetical protein
MTASWSNAKPQAGIVLGWLLLAFFTGCGDSSHQFAEVEGTVTLNNKPLAGAIVRFYPVSEKKEQLPYSSAMTDDAGFYTLTHGNNRPGALVGHHRVVVTWPSRDRRGDKPAPTLQIPSQYTIVNDDNPLKFEVKPGERQTINLTLQEPE